MKYILYPLLAGLFLCACGPSDQTEVATTPDTTIVMLRVSQVAAGMNMDTTLPSITISTRITGRVTDGVEVGFSGDTTGKVMNVVADSAIFSGKVDSIISRYCKGKDLRLIGELNGEKVALPFHTLDRFHPHSDSLPIYEWDYHLLFIDSSGLSVNDWKEKIEPEDYFLRFYGNAFAPHDSVERFPQREPNEQTITDLMLEGQAWDETDIKRAPDTAAMLAAYNEFVNKLEIFDKVGPFHTMRIAAITIETPDNYTWARVLHTISVHYKVVHELRNSAKEYLAAKQANDGAAIQKEFTDEDLRLLYPDRLVWNGRVSGVHEHRYDPMLLAPWFWTQPPPLIVPQERISADQ